MTTNENKASSSSKAFLFTFRLGYCSTLLDAGKALINLKLKFWIHDTTHRGDDHVPCEEGLDKD
jgi:hypothetical protein